MKNQLSISKSVAALALVGVFVASTTGGAVGAAMITGADIADGSVGGVDLRDGSVAGVDLRDGSVASTDLKDGAVAPADIKDNSMWAIVGVAGHIYQTNGVEEVQRNGGQYHVRFTRAVKDRALIVTLYSYGGAFTPPGTASARPCVVGTDNFCPTHPDASKWAYVLTQLGDNAGVSQTQEAARAFLIVALPAAPGTITPPPPA